MTSFASYRLPDGRIVLVDTSAARDARLIDYTLADGSIVIARQVRFAEARDAARQSVNPLTPTLRARECSQSNTRRSK